MQHIIAKRLKAAREAKGLTQQELSDQLGFKDRQTLAAIEAGVRKISAEELLKLIQILGRDLDYFSDPYRIEGEGSFSWRVETDVDTETLAEFEARAGSWVGMYRALASPEATRSAPLALSLTAKSSPEEASAAAEWLGEDWRLGDVPAARLEATIQQRLRVVVLQVNTPAGVSAAACRLPGFSAVLINRNQPPTQRNFHLAHELFHLLTWETMEPPHTESASLDARNRTEQMANAFAMALLIPDRAVRTAFAQLNQRAEEVWPRPEDRPPTTLSPNWLNARAREFQVSTDVFQWRLVHLAMLTKDRVDRSLDWMKGDARALKDERRMRLQVAQRELREAPETPVLDAIVAANVAVPPRGHEHPTPTPYNKDFVRVLHAAIGEKKITRERAAQLLGLDNDELADLFRSYQLKEPR